MRYINIPKENMPEFWPDSIPYFSITGNFYYDCIIIFGLLGIYVIIQIIISIKKDG